MDVQFSNPRWLLLPGFAAFFLVGLFWWLMWCQGIEDRAITIDLMAGDVEEATRQVVQPEIFTPCWESYADVCWPKYMRALWFFLLGIASFVMGCICFHRYRTVIAGIAAGAPGSPRSPRSPVSEGTPKNLREFLGQFSRSAEFTAPPRKNLLWNILLELSCVRLFKRLWACKKKIGPGTRYFWIRVTVSCVADVIMQFLRAFVVEGSLATTSAGFTIAQTALIIVHIWVFLYTFYMGSETMYFFTQFVTEFGYLIIRVSLSGALSMATTDFLDFLTLALPLFQMCLEVLEISNFILDHNPKDNRSTSKRLKWAFIAIGLIATAAGGVVIGICIYKGFIVWCPSVDPTELVDLAESEKLFGEIYKLQPGVFGEGYCYAWVFNLWLTPGCACYYLVLHPLVIDEGHNAPSTTCAGLSSNNHTAIKPFFPYLENLRFLFIDGALDNTILDCIYVTERDYELVSNWTQLRVLRWPGMATYRTEYGGGGIPSSWKSLKNLASIELSASQVSVLDQAIFDSWPLLESFVCVACPQLANMSALADATLPRLRKVEIYGVDECAPLPEHIDATCVPMRDPPNATCKGIPEWYLRGFLDVARQTKTTKCTQPTCSQYFDDFHRLDKDGNGVLDGRELAIMSFNRMSWAGFSVDFAEFNDWNVLQLECSMREILKATPFPISNSGYELSDGWPMAAFLAADLRYTMCTDCHRFRKEADSRYTKYLQLKDDMISSGYSEECLSIAQGGLSFKSLDAACANQRTDCDAGICRDLFAIVLAQDSNFDSNVDASEMMSAAGYFGLSGLLGGDAQTTYDCLLEHAPNCADVQNGTQISLGTLVILGSTLFDWPAGDISRCTDCPIYQDHLASVTAPNP